MSSTTILSEPRPISSREETPHPRYWTVSEFQRASDLGLFGSEERLELIHGEIIEHMPPNEPHSNGIDYARAWLTRVLMGIDCYIRSENPISIPEDLRMPDNQSRPQPDIVVAQGDHTTYHGRFPRPDEILLIAEVADSSLDYDRGAKAQVYATARIREYWIINLRGRCIEVHRDPQEGESATTFTVTVTDTLAPLVAPEAARSVSSLLP